MVERKQGEGEHYKDFLRANGRLTNKFSYITLTEENSGKASRFLEQNPDVDKRTWHVTNVTDNNRDPIEVLSGKKGDLDPLRKKYEPTSDLPPAQETHIVRVFDPNTNSARTVPVLIDNIESAKQIAKSKVANDGFERRILRADALHVTPEDFVAMIRILIDQGDDVSERFLRFAGLDAYKKEADKKRKQSKSA